MGRTVAIEDATLEALASNPVAVKQLPYLLSAVASARASMQTEGCPRCVADARAAIRKAYARTKQAIAAISPADRQILKDLLRADHLVVNIASPNGTVHSLTL